MLTHAPTRSVIRTVDAPAAEVYRALITPAALRDWLCDAAEVDPRPGGRAYFWWNDGYYSAGVFKELARDERLAFTWRGPTDSPGTITVALAPQDTATAVTVTYEAVDDIAPDEAGLTARWEAALENLQSVLETGIDQRLARRPMFGLMDGGEVGADRAARLGVPVTTGIWIGGLVEGLGAYAAGLQRDDVVIRLDDQPTPDFASFAAAIAPHRAGDRVPVVYYRGPEQHTATLELAQRPQLDTPDTVEGLVAAARKSYATVDTELVTALDGVTEASAELRPAPGEWNIKDVVAHLIAVERDTHSWIVSISEDDETNNPFHNNVPQRVRGLTAAYPTLEALTDELHKAEVATVAMLDSLPAELNARKHLLRRLGGWLVALPDHSREHFAEIEALKERTPA
jgi:uncharacterized protein YndB with AHSA1/START domain